MGKMLFGLTVLSVSGAVLGWFVHWAAGVAMFFLPPLLVYLRLKLSPAYRVRADAIIRKELGGAELARAESASSMDVSLDAPARSTSSVASSSNLGVTKRQSGSSSHTTSADASHTGFSGSCDGGGCGGGGGD